MSIVLDYPWWFILFCIIAALGYSSTLYYHNKKLEHLPEGLKKLLILIRGIVVFFLCFLLLSPLVNLTLRKVEKPILVIAQDNSQSLVIGKDSTFYKTTYKQKLNHLISTLSDKYNVHLYSFGSTSKTIKQADSIKYNEQQTSISDLLENIENNYNNRNLGAIVLSTDGLYNKGTNPIYASKNINIPIYTIALGDTSVKKDLILKDVEHNKLTFLGNQFPLNIIISAKQLSGKESTLKINKGRETIFTKKININSSSFISSIPVLIDAKEPGIQHYKITLQPVQDETTTANNVKDVFIEVLDSRQKIAIVASYPHPDIAAIKSGIESNQNYEVESFTLGEFNKPLKQYNMVILHGSKAIEKLNDNTCPVWAISGVGTILNNDLSTASAALRFNESEPVLEPNFSLFTMSDHLKKMLPGFPAVNCPHGNYKKQTDNNILLYQKIGAVETAMPLMSFNNTSTENKSAVFYGEGLWKWRLQDFLINDNHNAFDEFITKTIQCLSVKVDKSFFRISCPHAITENESVIMNAEVYNDSYELINKQDVTIAIQNENGKAYEFTFTQTNNSYRLDAGILPAGIYTFKAKVVVGNKTHIKQGKFHVIPLQIESLNLVADHQMLYNLAQKHKAQMVYPDSMEQLAVKLNNRNDIASVAYTQNKTSDLINYKWLFFVLLIFITTEWLIRKRNGL